jgi:hypothetical protein
MTKFFPSKDMTLAERLNATIRFTFYFSILMFLYKGNGSSLFITIIALAITYYIWQSQPPEKIKFDEKLKAAHDKALYDVNSKGDPVDLYSQLKEKFNNKPITRKLKIDIMESQRKSMGYGQVVRWLQDNTTSVPTPMSWEIKKEQFVNNLFEWICCLDDDYSWYAPSHTQVVFFKKDFYSI